MAVISVTKDNIEDIKKSDKLVLLDFFATWCGPCQMVSPLVDEIAEEHPEYLVGKIDIDEETDLAEDFGVMSIPTLVVLKDGEVLNKHTGALPKARILALLQ